MKAIDAFQHAHLTRYSLLDYCSTRRPAFLLLRMKAEGKIVHREYRSIHAIPFMQLHSIVHEKISNSRCFLSMSPLRPSVWYRTCRACGRTRPSVSPMRIFGGTKPRSCLVRDRVKTQVNV